MTVQNKEIIIFDNIERIADYAIELWTELSSKAIADKGHFAVALSGGKTPEVFYQKLSERKDLPWSKTHVFMVDERFVPYDSEDNNYHMINRTLLCHVTIPANNIHFISTVENTAEDSAIRYEESLRSYAKKAKTQYPLFDLIFLGIGDDGHTASLFPGTPALQEIKQLATYVAPPKNPEIERITLTYPVINSTKNIFFLATGENKAAVIKDVIKNKKSKLPAAMFKQDNNRVCFLLDKASASKLTGK